MQESGARFDYSVLIFSGNSNVCITYYKAEYYITLYPKNLGIMTVEVALVLQMMTKICCHPTQHMTPPLQ